MFHLLPCVHYFSCFWLILRYSMVVFLVYDPIGIMNALKGLGDSRDT